MDRQGWPSCFLALAAGGGARLAHDVRIALTFSQRRPVRAEGVVIATSLQEPGTELDLVPQIRLRFSEPLRHRPPAFV